MGELDVILNGKSLADYTNTRLRLALGAVLYTNTADMWDKYLKSLGYSGSVSAMLQKYYVDYAVPKQFQNYINAGAGIFYPTDFFTDGSKGYIYDNNDLSSFYLDSAGTTAATVNGLVGLQLDKSQGGGLGVELVPDGNYAGTVDAGFSFSGRTIVRNGTSINGALLTLSTASVVGVFYRVTMDVTGITGDTLIARVGAINGAYYSITANGSYSFLVQAGATNARLQVSGLLGTTGTATISNISVKELPGNHRYQTTTGSKPILRGTPVGSNLVTNGGFDTGTGWTLGAGVNISGGTLNVDGTISQAAGIALATPTTPFAVAIGRVYRIEWQLVSYTSTEAISVYIGGVYGAARYAAGTFVDYITATTTEPFIIYTRGLTATRTAAIDNIVIRDVTADAVTAPYGLQYDGVDDFLTTASVDFTATDKMAVVMGAQKLSDVAYGIVMEHGVGGVDARPISVAWPRTGALASATIQIRDGVNVSECRSAPVAAPVTSVIAATADYLGSTIDTETAIRMNGSSSGNTYSGGTVTGSFGNYPLYFGRRGNNSAPFTGLDYGGICVNKTLTASQLSSAERWTAIRTGVTL